MTLEELKKEYIGKTFNWLTVLDVYTGGKGIGTMFKCQCKCSNVIGVSKRSILSQHTKSCGCYKHSKELGNKLRQAYLNNPELCNKRSATLKLFYENNTDSKEKISKRISELYKNNTDKVIEKAEKYKDICKNKRKQCNFNELIPIIHPDYVDRLLNGEIGSCDIIKIKCRLCGKYEDRVLRNIFIISKGILKKCVLLLCKNCFNNYTSSNREREIADYVSTFYNGKSIKNSRDIIPPLELDLYYPEKNIAIEFNGDYWHSSEFKPKDYHYNKFITCKNVGIILVSIFEVEWVNNSDAIKAYLYDLFNNKENQLSSIDDYTVNNNYPSPLKNGDTNNYIESYYMCGDYKVFTCGYSRIQ